MMGRGRGNDLICGEYKENEESRRARSRGLAFPKQEMGPTETFLS